MYVILDTNIIHRDYFFRSKSIIALFSYLNTCGHKLLLPRTVIGELESHYKQELDEINNEVRKIRSNYNILSLNKKPGYVDASLKAKEYKSFIHGFVRDKKIVILENDEKNFQKIINKCLRKEPPFTSPKGDKGFKDALIWENVKEASKEKKYRPFCFITKNKSEFSDTNDSSNLHPILKNEILSSNLPFYFLSLESFLEKYGSIMKDVSREVIENTIGIGLKNKIDSMSEKDIESIFSMRAACPIYSLDKETFTFELKHYYVMRADEKNYFVTATGIVTARPVLFDPIDEEFVSDQMFTSFEATIKIQKKSKHAVIESFDIETLDLS